MRTPKNYGAHGSRGHTGRQVVSLQYAPMQTPQLRRAVRFVVHGRVQGVSYRASARRAAERIGVGGWVRNRQDGAVEGVVEGDPARVAQFLDWCRTGPPLAQVSGVDLADAPTSAFVGFEVRH